VSTSPPAPAARSACNDHHARGTAHRRQPQPVLEQGWHDGDLVIEINEPSVDSRFESHQIAYQWAQLNLPVSTGREAADS
jgi:hypothetical protein